MLLLRISGAPQNRSVSPTERKESSKTDALPSLRWSFSHFFRLPSSFPPKK